MSELGEVGPEGAILILSDTDLHYLNMLLNDQRLMHFSMYPNNRTELETIIDKAVNLIVAKKRALTFQAGQIVRGPDGIGVISRKGLDFECYLTYFDNPTGPTLVSTSDLHHIEKVPSNWKDLD